MGPCGRCGRAQLGRAASWSRWNAQMGSQQVGKSLGIIPAHSGSGAPCGEALSPLSSSPPQLGGPAQIRSRTGPAVPLLSRCEWRSLPANSTVVEGGIRGVCHGGNFPWTESGR